MQAIRTIEKARVVDNQRVAERTFITKFHSPKIARMVTPGQFVMISFPDCLDPLLARAFSVSDAHGENLSLLYTTVGKGTTKLSRLRIGENVIINGPLGNGFPKLSKKEKVWIVVGGSGAALVPILSSSAMKAEAIIKIFYGAKTKKQIVHFKNIRTISSTDDGSKGFHGMITDLLEKHLTEGQPDKIFGCGPTAMLEVLRQKVGLTIPLYVSVETPMACGMGFCQGCPVKVKGSLDYFLACKDGPVFNARGIKLGGQSD